MGVGEGWGGVSVCVWCVDGGVDGGVGVECGVCVCVCVWGGGGGGVGGGVGVGGCTSVVRISFMIIKNTFWQLKNIDMFNASICE